MNFSNYQKLACSTAIYPQQERIKYPALGLADSDRAAEKAIRHAFMYGMGAVRLKALVDQEPPKRPLIGNHAQQTWQDRLSDCLYSKEYTEARAIMIEHKEDIEDICDIIFVVADDQYEEL